jgi:hypothetical protein
MPTLKEVLADKAKYADNLSWDMGGGSVVTLGQLRELSAHDQNVLSRREQEVAARDAELKAAQITTANLYTTVQAAQEAIKAGRMDDPAVKTLFGNTPVPGSNNNNNDPFAALSRLESDTLIGPVISVIKQIKADALKAQADAAQVIDIQKNMATAYLNDTLEERYDRIVPADKQDKITLEALIQNAVQNKHFTRANVPDIKKAYRNLTAADTQAAREAEIREDERKKVRAELDKAGQGGGASDIFIGRGANTFGLDVHNRGGDAPKAYKNLDEAFAAAEKDPSIWSQVDKLA